jgi:L-asparaginase
MEIDKLPQIHLIITGGTIDSGFDGVHDELRVNNISAVVDYLKDIVRPNLAFTQEILTMKDSRQITDNTRAEILSSIQRSDVSRILITHGTYTMVDTLNYLEQQWQHKDKVVFLTGSMFPLRNFSPTDAPFNLGFAIGAMMYAEPGVYLAMNGEVFKATEVVKDLSLGRFKAIEGSSK